MGSSLSLTKNMETRLGLKCQPPEKVTFALASLDSLKIRSSVFSLETWSFMKFILGLQQMLSLKKILGLKKIWFQENVGSKKNFGSKKILGSKKCWVWKN